MQLSAHRTPGRPQKYQMEGVHSRRLALASGIARPRNSQQRRYLPPKADPFGCVRRANLRSLYSRTPRTAVFARLRSTHETFEARVYLSDLHIPRRSFDLCNGKSGWETSASDNCCKELT